MQNKKKKQKTKMYRTKTKPIPVIVLRCVVVVLHYILYNYLLFSHAIQSVNNSKQR